MKHLIPLLLVILISACEKKTEYEKLVHDELNKEIRHDTLFLGYELGMEKEEFFDRSWEMNQKNIITGTAQIKYPLDDFSSDATMVFYPEFHNDRLVRMPVEISFDAWAIWNRELHSDYLIEELIEYYEEIYGDGFIYTAIPDLNQEAWVKIDGNRRILIYPKDDMIARVEILDLSVDRD